MTLRVIAKNAGWMSLVQLLNYALPLLMVPFVTRALGARLYGVYALGLSYGAYCSLLVEYGFFYEATRLVARDQTDITAIRRVHSAVLAGKALLGVIALLGVLIVLLLSGADRREIVVFLALSISSVLWSFAPVWVFVALQRMGEMGAAQIASRAVFTAATILLVRGPGDLMCFALLQLASYALLSTYLMLRLSVMGIGICRVTPGDLRTMFSSGAKFFASALATGAYGASSVIIVRQFASLTAVGHFALAERVRVMLASVVAPFSLAIYPFLSGIGHRSATNTERRTKTIYSWAVLGVAATVALLAFLTRRDMVAILAGSGFREAATFIAFFAATPLLTALNNLLATQTLIAQGHGRQASIVQVTGAVFGIALSYGLAARMGPIGVCIALLLTDLLVVLALAFFCVRLRRAPEVAGSRRFAAAGQ